MRGYQNVGLKGIIIHGRISKGGALFTLALTMYWEMHNGLLNMAIAE